MDSVAETANKNYARLNKNFDSISKFSMQLLHRQNVIVSQLDDLTGEEKKLKYQTFHINVMTMINSIYQSYEYSLQKLATHVKPPRTFIPIL